HHVGLALATSISAFINAALLYRGLKRTGILVHEAGWWRFFCQVLVANMVMLAVLYAVTPDAGQWYQFGMAERFGVMLLICAAGVVTYGTSLLLSGIRFQQLVR
ncbi:MAG: polysaccharide biosynthesis C-terminal domain-containing protein, partial [Gammaproteobacteria bacterium]|nr:polysaccharide biosynthesis C-terminal domain-containing protein [Gammaproteobacteria bacterium]